MDVGGRGDDDGGRGVWADGCRDAGGGGTQRLQATTSNLTFDGRRCGRRPRRTMAAMMAGLTGGQEAELGARGWDASDVQLRVAE